MTRADVDADSDDGSTGTAHGAVPGRGYASTVMGAGRRALGSGAGAGVGGGLLLLRGVRSLRRGARRRGLAQLLLGGVFVAVARKQRRSGGESGRPGVDQTDVVDTGPDLEEAATGSAGDSGPSAGGDEAASVVDTGPDVEDAGSGLEREDDTGSMPVDETDVVDTGVEDDLDDVEREPDGPGYVDAERLGDAAFDEESGRVPVPQRAFDLNLLSLGAEAFWGVRESDPAVFVSGNYDALEARDGVRYVASTEIDDDRGLIVPDAVRDHWDDVAGGGTAVTSGDGIVFATGDEVRADDRVLVVPEQWSDAVLGGET